MDDGFLGANQGPRIRPPKPAVIVDTSPNDDDPPILPPRPIYREEPKPERPKRNNRWLIA